MSGCLVVSVWWCCVGLVLWLSLVLSGGLFWSLGVLVWVLVFWGCLSVSGGVLSLVLSLVWCWVSGSGVWFWSFLVVFWFWWQEHTKRHGVH